MIANVGNLTQSITENTVKDRTKNVPDDLPAHVRALAHWRALQKDGALGSAPAARQARGTTFSQAVIWDELVHAGVKPERIKAEQRILKGQSLPRSLLAKFGQDDESLKQRRAQGEKVRRRGRTAPDHRLDLLVDPPEENRHGVSYALSCKISYKDRWSEFYYEAQQYNSPHIWRGLLPVGAERPQLVCVVDRENQGKSDEGAMWDAEMLMHRYGWPSDVLVITACDPRLGELFAAIKDGTSYKW